MLLLVLLSPVQRNGAVMSTATIGRQGIMEGYVVKLCTEIHVTCDNNYFVTAVFSAVQWRMEDEGGQVLQSHHESIC